MPATDKEFFDYEIASGITPENPDYYNLMDATANIIIEYAKDIIEIGAGMGTLGECLIKKGCDYYGIEPNPHHQDFALTRGITLYGLERFPVECHYPKYGQMIVSIEVFEHLTDDQIGEYLNAIDCQYFLLSSTPNKTTEEFDAWWGHINLKSEEEWIKLFSEFGFTLEKKLTLPTEWSLLFRK